MKCVNCGFESQEDSKYCVNCGAQLENPIEQGTEPEPNVNPLAERFLNIFRDGMFLAICILQTAACVFSIINDGLPVILILLSIFLWITYAKARKGVVNSSNLRNISGTVYANYVIINVLSGILIVCSIIIMFAFRIVANTPEAIAKIMEEIELNYPKYLKLPEEIYSIIGWIFGFVFLFIAAILLVVNLLGMRKIHRFAKSVYMAIDTQTPYFENPYAVRNWLIFFGVCSAISAVFSIGDSMVSAIGNACSAAAIIIAAAMIKKYFLLNQNNNNF